MERKKEIKREKSFSVNEEYKWVDRIGVVHPCCDEWALKIQRRCRKRLALDFTVSVIDIDEAVGDCIECGREGSFIICKSLMENLVRLAQKQADGAGHVETGEGEQLVRLLPEIGIDPNL